MSGVVKINITETEEEIKALLGKVKDVHRHEKLQAIYGLKTKTVETVSSIAVRVGKHRTTDREMVVYLSSRGNGTIIIPQKTFGKTKNN